MAPRTAVEARTPQHLSSSSANHERRYTGHPDGPGVCAICGCHRERHHVVGDRCPHTVDSLDDDQILGWWRAGGRGGSFLDALDASPELRLRVRNAALYYPEPTCARSDDARALIADVLNAAARFCPRDVAAARGEASVDVERLDGIDQSEPDPPPETELVDADDEPTRVWPGGML